MNILDHVGNPYKKPIEFSVDYPSILDKDGHIVNTSRRVKRWSKALFKSVELESYFDKFTGSYLYDQFGYKLNYIPEGKGNVIQLSS